ncbi:hypothetical protein DXG01_002413 [Tephrocybe rancida]|nr:hypothetical protein DXG01_002413 [Tephrocybe rancida]
MRRLLCYNVMLLCVDLKDIVCAHTEIASLCLKPKDRVIVTSGKLVGMTGTITSFSEDANEATISIDAKEGIMDVVVPPINLQKVIRVGDRVRVVGGIREGRVGWVVAVNGTELHVSEDTTAQQINVNRVVFHHDTQLLLNDTKLQPLKYKFHAGTFVQPDMPPPAEVVIPQSILPLILSTPIPTGTSVEMGPAWNPSSRMLNPHRKFSCNPYMEHWHMDRKLRVKVHLHNTKPILHDPSWKSRDYKDGKGIWKATDTDEAGYAKVQLMWPAFITLPPGHKNML